MAAARSAVLSGTPVGTASRISWVSVMLYPRMECSALGRCRAVRLGEASITRVNALLPGRTANPRTRPGRRAEGQRALATVKLNPVLRWLKVARPAAGEVVVHPAMGFPAAARKLVNSAEAVPQAMLGLDTV